MKIYCNIPVRIQDLLKYDKLLTYRQEHTFYTDGELMDFLEPFGGYNENVVKTNDDGSYTVVEVIEYKVLYTYRCRYSYHDFQGKLHVSPKTVTVQSIIPQEDVKALNRDLEEHIQRMKGDEYHYKRNTCVLISTSEKTISSYLEPIQYV